MDFYVLLNTLEREFLLLTGLSFPRLLGLLLGSTLFSLILLLLRYEKKLPLDTDISNFNDVGDPDEARINLSRSLFEMGQTAKAQELLGWKPVITMDEQLKKTADAYLEHEKTL